MRTIKSKYQSIAKTQLKQTTTHGRKQYYDEKITPKTKNSSNRLYAIVMLVVVIGGLSVIGGTLDNGEEDTSNQNPITDNSGDSNNDATSTTYKNAIDVVDIEGNSYNLADYEGKIVIFNLFDLDCYYCNLFHPELSSIEDTYGSQIKIFAIDVAPGIDTVAELQSWEATNHYGWPIILDNNHYFMNTYQVTGTPKIIYFAPDGSVGYEQPGYVTAENVAATIESLLE